MTLIASAKHATPDTRRALRVGFIYPQPDPLDARNWSGTPRSLALAITALGSELTPIGYAPARPLRHAATAASYIHGHGALARGSAMLAELRTRHLRRAVRAAGPLDALLALGTDLYDLERVAAHQIPTATYDDATLAQMMRHPESDPRRNGYPARAVARWAERQARASNCADACCVSTGWAAGSMIRDYGVAPERVHVVGIGHRPRSPRRAAGRDWSTPRFLFVGVDWTRKNGELVIRAFARLRHEHPDALLHLVGDHPPITEPGVIAHGFLPRQDAGAQSVLDRLYDSATAFVLPSRFDPAGIAWLEAASAGLPVIATTEGGASELLGDAAIRVHPDDEEALLAAMRRLACPAEAQRLGELARAGSLPSSWNMVAGRILSALDLDGSAPASAATAESF